MELSTLEKRVIWALSDHGPAGISTIMGRVEGLDSKAQLKQLLNGLVDRGVVKFQSNGQWSALKHAKGRAIETASDAAPTAKKRTSTASPMLPTVATSPDSAIPPAHCAAQPDTSGLADSLINLANSLPDGVELRLNKDAVIVLWNSRAFHSSAPELSGTLHAIKTLDQQLVPQ